MTAWNEVSRIVERLKPPTFAARELIVRDERDFRGTLQAAIATLSMQGGGKIVIPPGTYRCAGPIQLASNIHLHLDEAEILFSTKPTDYLVGDAAVDRLTLTRWEGTRCFNYSPLIYAYGQRNIAVTGRGTFDGQAANGWAPFKELQSPTKQRLRAMGQAVTPVLERRFGEGHYLRPSMFSPYDCQNILLDGITFKASPFWTIHPIFCDNVIVRNCTVLPGTTNDDGCDPESCRDVLIEKCTFSTADDNIALKAGRDQDAWASAGGRPCENIVIRDCMFLQGRPGGISIGSEMSGGIRNVFIERCTFKDAARVLYLKASPHRGGILENIFARDLTIDACEEILYCKMAYKFVIEGDYPSVFRNIELADVRCQRADTAVRLIGLDRQPIGDVRVSNVQVTDCKRFVEQRAVTSLIVDGKK